MAMKVHKPPRQWRSTGIRGFWVGSKFFVFGKNENFELGNKNNIIIK